MTDQTDTVPKKWDEMEDRDDRGQFVPGHSGGPGRPKGSLDFMKIARAYAKRTGHSLDKVVEIAARALVKQAARGDVPAIKVLLDRTCGPQNQGTTVNVGIDARTAITDSVGPSMPQGADFKAYLEKLTYIAAQQGLLGDTTPEEIVENAVRVVDDEQDEIERLLS